MLQCHHAVILLLISIVFVFSPMLRLVQCLSTSDSSFNDNLQKQDYAFNNATNEYSEQTSVRVPKAVIGINVVNVLIVE